MADASQAKAMPKLEGRFESRMQNISCYQPHKLSHTKCGYCYQRGVKSRRALGGVMHRITPQDYDFMLERNWMRRTHAPSFDANKQHTKVLKTMEAFMRGDKSVLPPGAEGHPSRDVELAAAAAVSALKVPSDLELALGAASLLLMEFVVSKLDVACPPWLSGQLRSASRAVERLQAMASGQATEGASLSTTVEEIASCVAELGAVAGCMKHAPRKGAAGAPKVPRGGRSHAPTFTCGLTRRLANHLKSGMSATDLAKALVDAATCASLQPLVAALAAAGYFPIADGPFLNWEPQAAAGARSADTHSAAATAATDALHRPAGHGGAAAQQGSLPPWTDLVAAAKHATAEAARHQQRERNAAQPGTFGKTPQPLPQPTHAKRIRVAGADTGSDEVGGEQDLWVSEDDSDSDGGDVSEKQRETRRTRLESQQSVHAILGGGLFGDGYQGEVVRALAAREAEWRRGGQKGPCHRLTVRLARPAYSKQAHECYTRFNMKLHRGLPHTQNKGAIERHMINSPILNAPMRVVEQTPAGLALRLLDPVHPRFSDAENAERAEVQHTLLDHRWPSQRPPTAQPQGTRSASPAVTGGLPGSSMGEGAASSVDGDANVSQLRTPLSWASSDVTDALPASMEARASGSASRYEAPNRDAWLDELPTALREKLRLRGEDLRWTHLEEDILESGAEPVPPMGDPLAETAQQAVQRIRAARTSLVGSLHRGAQMLGQDAWDYLYAPDSGFAPSHADVSSMVMSSYPALLWAQGMRATVARKPAPYAFPPGATQQQGVEPYAAPCMYLRSALALQLALEESDQRTRRLYAGELRTDRMPVSRGLQSCSLAFHPSFSKLEHHFKNIFTVDGCPWAHISDRTQGDAAAQLLPLDGSSGYGTFWLEFYIDGYLACVSTVDILPSRLASVYCFYLPALRHMEWGKYSALTEMFMTQRLSLASPLLQYWDANFYVNTSSQMLYKDTYTPAELQCPHSGVWVPFDSRVKAMLREEKLPPIGALLAVPPGEMPDDEAKEETLLLGSLRAVDEDEAAEQVVGDVCMDNGFPRGIPPPGEIRSAAQVATQARQAAAAAAASTSITSSDATMLDRIPWARLEDLGITRDSIQSLLPALNGSLHGLLSELASVLGDDSWIYDTTSVVETGDVETDDLVTSQSGADDTHSLLASDPSLGGAQEVQDVPQHVQDECSSAFAAALQLPRFPALKQYLQYKLITKAGKDMVGEEMHRFLAAMGPDAAHRFVIDPLGLFHFHRKKREEEAAAAAAAERAAREAAAAAASRARSGSEADPGEAASLAADDTNNQHTAEGSD